jgi:DNA replication protein DnaC
MRRLEEILRQELAARAGSPADTGAWSAADQEEAACPLCGGAGFVRAAVSLGHPDFGKALPCRCVAEESEERRSARLLRYSNLGPLTRLTFDSLIEEGRSSNPRDQDAYGVCVAAAREFADEPEGWLVLVGPSGCGKTHVAAAIANRCIQQGRPARFVVVPDLLDHLRASYGPAARPLASSGGASALASGPAAESAPEEHLPYDQFFQQVRDAPVLILDDLGAQTTTPWAQEKLFQLINHRFNSRAPTVVTTSLELEDLDERLASRLGDPSLSRVFRLGTGRSRRPGAPATLSLPLLRDMTFENFDVRSLSLSPEASGNLRRAFVTARNYACDPDGWLVFLGGTGSGKTHLAAAIAHEWQAAGRRFEFFFVPDLLDTLRAARSRENDLPGSTLDWARTCDHLVLDDLGVHGSTPWAQEKLFQILNYRYNAKLPTVVTIRGSLEGVPESWASRMSDAKVSLVFEIEAPDYRGLPRRRREETEGGGRRRGKGPPSAWGGSASGEGGRAG